MKVRKALTHQSFLEASYKAYAEAVLKRHTKQQIRILEIAALKGKALEPAGRMAGKSRN